MMMDLCLPVSVCLFVSVLFVYLFVCLLVLHNDVFTDSVCV